MKKIFLFLVTLFVTNFAMAQLSVSVSNVHYCPTLPENPGAGAQLTAEVTGGTPPYTYCWETEPYTGLNDLNPDIPIIYTSGMMSDTSIYNPTVFTQYANPAYFRVTVTDANNMIAYDTCLVTRSYFMTTAGYGQIDFHIATGDSVYLPGLISTYPCQEFAEGSIVKWSPVESLSSGTTNYDEGVWAKPETATVYSMTLVDGAGCEWDDEVEYTVTVGPTSIRENDASTKLKLHPNPTTHFISIENENETPIQEITLIDLSGKKHQVNWSENKIDLSPFPQGIYIVEILLNEQVISKKVVKQ